MPHAVVVSCLHLTRCLPRAPAEDFVVSGNNTDALLGVCESMYRTGLKPEELFETISQCLLSAVNRDCLSGWGGVVHIITPTVRP